MMDDERKQEFPEGKSEDLQHRTTPLKGMYEDWFLDYASYVILERAVPEAMDGLKPVQRRIFHAMREMDDGRFHKVANIIGQTMQYHPHGDASIGDALVQLGQKDLLIETQGNWGNILTGDSSAAPRYIEARLSKFALEVLFNPKITRWKLSYDGRKKEPVALPVKFPLLLAQGVEGIAVGLASKVLPHNFVELLDASIAILRDEEFEIYPDFVTGGYIDVSRYNDGLRGGRVRIRAKIQQQDKKTLAITEIPYYTTTSSLIESILAANDKGKIKVKKVDDNTAEKVEILIHLASGVSPDQTIDALYAFTDCEMSISPNNCVIHDGKPRFLGVRELLSLSTDHTVDLLAEELEIKLNELEEQWHFASLERIFIEKRIYRKIEKSETWDAVISDIEKGLQPHIGELKREVTKDDIIRLTEIRIKKISKYDIDRAEENIKKIEEEIAGVRHNLDNLVDYAIAWFANLKEKYGKGRERKSEIRSFETIEATAVAAATQKLYVNREEGFAGTSLKKDEFVSECSDIDDIIAFRADGTFIVTKVAGKVFVGKDIIHIDVFKRNDDRTVYNMVYQDGRAGKAMVKRFSITSVTRDREYDLTAGKKGSRVLYFTANPNGEAELIHVMLRPRPRMKKTSFDFDFSELNIRGRGSKGNILSKYLVRKITKKEEGVSTLGAISIWYDETVNRINTDERGTYLGDFQGDDKIIGFNRSGSYRTYGYDVTTHFEEDMFYVQKLVTGQVFTLVYLDGKSGDHYIKRFIPEESEKNVSLITNHPDSGLVLLSKHSNPEFRVKGLKRTKSRDEVEEDVDAVEYIAVKGITAKGKKLAAIDVTGVEDVSPEEMDESGSESESEGTEQEEEQEQDKISDTEHPGAGGELGAQSGTDPERSEGTEQDKDKEKEQEKNKDRLQPKKESQKKKKAGKAVEKKTKEGSDKNEEKDTKDGSPPQMSLF